MTGVPAKSSQANRSATLGARFSIGAAGLLLLAALAACLVSPFLAIQQSRLPFPGFLVEPNLTVSALARPGWAGESVARSGVLWRVRQADGHEVHSPAELDAYLQTVPVGRAVTYTLAFAWDPSSSGQGVAIPTGRLPTLDTVLFFWGPYLVALTYLVCGIWIYRGQWAEPAARACAIACAAVALTLALTFDVLWGHHVDWLWVLGLALIGAGALHMGMLFPEPLPLVRRFPWSTVLPYLLAAACAARWEFDYASGELNLSSGTFRWPAGLWLGATSVLLLGGIFYTWRSTRNAPIRGQARSVLLGGLLAFVPTALAFAAPLVQFDATPFLPAVYLALAAFPLTMAFAIARRNLFNLDRTVRRSLGEGLIAILVGAVYLLAVYGIGRAASGLLQPSDPLALAFLVLLAALLVGPVQRYLYRLTARWFQHEQVDFRQAVQEFGYSLAQVIGLPELSHLILERVAGTLGLDAASLYLFEPPSGMYRLYEAWSGIEVSNAPAFAETDAFIQALHSARGAILRFSPEGSVVNTLPPEESLSVNRLRAILFLPLRTKNGLVGWLNLGARRSGRGYAREDVALLGALADRAAVAIENARLFAERERRLTELAVLNEIGQAINSPHGLEQTLESIYSETGRLMDTANFFIALYNPERQEVSFPVHVARGERLPGAARQFANGLTEHVLRTQQPLLIAERVEEQVRSLGLELHGPPACSWLGVPILREGQAIGVIAVQTTEAGSRYDVEDLNILSAIANQAAIAIENARLYEVTDQALAGRLEEITVLSDFARILATVALDPEQVAEQTLRRAVETLKARSGILIRFDQEQNAFVPLAQLRWPSAEAWQESWRTLLPDVLAAAPGPLVYATAAPDGSVATVEGAPMQVLCALIREDTPLAVLHLALPGETEPDEDRRLFLRYLADHAAIALENALLYQKQVQQGQVLDTRARHLAEILNLSIAIRANMDLDQVLQFVIQAVRDTLGFGIVLVSLVDEKDPSRLRRAAAFGIEADLFRRLQAEKLPLSTYEEMLRPELRVGQSYMLGPSDSEAVEQMRHYRERGRPLLALQERPEWNEPGTILTPLRGTADRLLGSLSVAQPPDKKVPSRESVEILEIIANQAAVAIENARLYQALREAYETKGEFLSLVAHELQVPMGTLWGYADLLDREIANVDLGTLRGFVQVLKANVARFDALVQDLLEVSRAEAGALHLERTPLDLGEVIMDSIATVRPQVERRGLTLTVDVPFGLATVLADRDRLGQVFDNLLSNACKYTPAPGQVTVSMRLISSMAELNGSGPAQGSVRCPCILATVGDSGIGISRAEQKRVFTRFFRSDHPVVRQEAGTGLGLYLVRLLVESQGGRVWLESEPEQGSRFFVALPAAGGGVGGNEAKNGQTSNSQGQYHRRRAGRWRRHRRHAGFA